MKRIRFLLSAVLTAALITMLALPAAADNAFFLKHAHSGDLTYLPRMYKLTGDGRSVDVYDEPDGSVLETIPTGATLGSNYLSGDWVYVRYNITDTGEVREEGMLLPLHDGWVRRSDLSPLYDAVSFQEQFGEQFADWGAAGPTLDLRGIEGAYEWKYPGFMATPYTIRDGDVYLNGRHELQIPITWHDDRGGTWGFVPGWHDSFGVWIDLNAPDVLDHQKMGVQYDPDRTAPYNIEPQRQAEQARLNQSSAKSPVWITLAAMAVLLVAGVLALCLIRRSKRRRGESLVPAREIAQRNGFNRAAFEVFLERAGRDGQIKVHGLGDPKLSPQDAEKAADQFREHLQELFETEPERPEPEELPVKKKRRVPVWPFVLLALVLIVCIAELILIRRSAYLAVVNETDGPYYGVQLTYRKGGTLDLRSYASQEVISGTVWMSEPDMASNTDRPLEIGRWVPLKVDSKFLDDRPIPDDLNVAVSVKRSPERGVNGQAAGYLPCRPAQGKGLEFTVPLTRGRRTVIVVTGSAKEGYYAEVRGTVSMLRGAELTDFLP